MNLTLASLFDGSGTAPLAASMCGITPVWASEIEPYPIRVTTKRFPNMKHYGSITDIDGAKVEPVDIICGGSPCQDLSVAGKQAGLDGGTRSHLFYEMVRIIKEMRKATDGKKPRYIVWENVPGAFSSNNGYDFMSVLQSFAEIAEADVHVPEPERKANKLVWRYAGEMVGRGWSIAWRTVDAQYWGVPQRRRRIYLVVDLDSECAGEILFERNSVSGNTEQSGEAGKETAADAHGSVNGENNVKCLNPWDSQTIRQYSVDGVAPNLNANTGGGQNRWGVCYPNVARTLTAEYDASPCIDRGQNICVYESKSALEENWSGSDVKNALRANASKSDHCVVYSIHDKATRYKGGGNTRKNDGAANGIGICDGNTMYTLDTACRHGIAYTADCRNAVLNHEISGTLQAKPNGGFSYNCINPVVYPGVGITSKENKSNPKPGDAAPTLDTDSRKYLVYANSVGALCARDYKGVSRQNVEENKVIAYDKQRLGVYEQNGVSSTLAARDYKDASDLVVEKTLCNYIVRRLTPLECSRLQGFPDCWELNLETPNPTEDDIAFWTEVFETHRKVVSPDVKPKTRKQIIKWLKDPYSDSASYKMWGNGMAFPNMLHVMKGISGMDCESKVRRTETEGE